MPSPDPTDRLPASGRWFLTCSGFVRHGGKDHDLIVEWRRRDGVWDREGLGLTPTLVGSLHELAIERQVGNRPVSLRAHGLIVPDAWNVVGGPADLMITLQTSDDGQVNGGYAGTFQDRPVEGRVTTRFEPDLPASRGVATARPAILDEFERTGAAGRLYDFRYAGRGTSAPDASLPVFDATDFGVRADSGQEAQPAIQAALDAAGAAGGGVVQLPAGVLDISVDEKRPPLRIRHARVVLRGAGSGPDGTLIVNHRYSDTPDPRQPWRAGEHPLLIIQPDPSPDPVPLTRVTSGQRGELRIEVADASALVPGQPYLLRQIEIDDGSLARDLVQGQVAVGRNWQGAGTELVSQLATVEAVEGSAVTLDAPLHRSIGRWPAELCAFPMLDACGVSHLRMRGLWGGSFVHHKNGEHDNGWDHVPVHRVRGGWFEDLVHENTTSALGLKDCLGCVVRGCRILGNPGHNGFVIGGRSTGNLIRECHAGRNMHGFNVQGTISGNAVVDCTMDEPSGIDLHGGIGCDNLFDALTGGVNKGGGSANAVPPRHGPGMVLWNWACGHYDPYRPWRRYDVAASHDQTPGFIAVGVYGAFGQPIRYATPDDAALGPFQEGWGWVESPGQRVAPRSLYAWQCGRG